ncbi:MAG: methyltransferase domain-containing protein [Desulfobulbaceae bacterium]|nr:methyltransferase domain-containing protein [Desulfobulbaceae bacterium]
MIQQQAAHELLVCPKERSPLNRIGDSLHCNLCGRIYPIQDGVPIFFSDQEWNELYIADGGDHYATEDPFQLAHGDPGYLALRGDDDYGLILDLGCGDGVFSSKVPGNFRSYCVDVTMAGLCRLQKRCMENLVPLLASGFELPFADKTFDTVLYIFVVEHLAPDGDLFMLQEIRRVLKDDGKVIFTTDTPFFDRHLVRWTSLLLRHEWINQDHYSSTGHINLLTMQQSRSLVKSAGLQIEVEHPYWMGSRFTWWIRLVSFLRNHLSPRVCEDYLTSKYSFILTKAGDEVGCS